MSAFTPEALDTIETRANAAFPGPWQFLFRNSWGGQSAIADAQGHPLIFTGDPDAHQVIEDAEFMAHCREDVPNLAAALREAWAENERLIRQSDGWAEVLADRETAQRERDDALAELRRLRTENEKQGRALVSARESLEGAGFVTDPEYADMIAYDIVSAALTGEATE